MAGQAVRRATMSDALDVAVLLDAFNREFDTPTPGPVVLAARLETVLTDAAFAVLLAGEPAVGLAVLSFRPTVWSDGPAATLDELYVRPALRGNGIGAAMLAVACELAASRHADSLEINVDGEDVDARRFYERHGFSHTEPGASEPMYYYYRQLDGGSRD